ncbi:uncharacterized protein G2W53_012326 [Senna tora]|uniref:Uncharacterized protein n=1 Tax=Senna tora TaxID=362788 RepID=A0A834TWL9_9FABA|nr:uncharacterized protein G2W53_012326 [Senna tora]
MGRVVCRDYPVVTRVLGDDWKRPFYSEMR